MVVAMGGEIRLDERPGLDGRGARFVVRLPRREPRKTREND
jgi:signal transduction histidine kinase